MRSTITLLSLALLISLTSCEESTKQTSTKVVSGFDYSGVIKEVVQTSNYTYCRIAEANKEYWIAVSRMDVKKGQTLYFNQGLEMKNFHSRELNRAFPLVFFVQKCSTEPNTISGNAPVNQQPVKPKIVNKGYDIEKADGGITIAELYANKDKYSGKKVKIRGKVTKFNSRIMNKNWVHIQDGTEYDGNFDLTVTSLESVNIYAVVTFEGIINIDKDFGAGYFYSVIMEDATVVK